MLNSTTNIFAIIGNPVSHSLSPIMHNAAFKVLKLNSVYLAFRVVNLKDAMLGIRALGIKGLSVTIPHKEKIINYLDKVDDFAAKMGAVNTVVNELGLLTGYNTDGIGAYNAIRETNLNLANKSVCIIGNGGTAHAIAFALLSKSTLKELIIFGRNKDKIKAFIQNIKKHFPFINISFYTAFDNEANNAIRESTLIINTTPVGMVGYELKSPIPENLITEKHTVFDVVYKPVRTKLIEIAQKKKAKVISGISMLLNQGTLQFELWTGQKAPTKIMLGAIQKALAV